jgi:hypothetical protein
VTVTKIVKRSLLAVSALALTLGVLFVGSSSAALAADSYQVRLAATPVKNYTPSFVTAFGDFLAWTGAHSGTSKMYVYDLLSGENQWIDPGVSGSYYNPAAEGDYVVFQGATPGGFDHIYIYNHQNDSLKSLPTVDGELNDWNPRIQGGRVVYEKDTSDPAVGSGIYVYDTATPSTYPKEILVGPAYRDPDIFGDYVVCVRDVASDVGPNATEIVLFNIATGADPVVIATSDKNNEDPRIDGTKIVWSSGDIWTPETASNWSKTYQICLYDIDSGQTTTLTNDLAGNLNPSVGGDLVAWQCWTPSSIKSYRISTGETSDVYVSIYGDTSKTPEVDGTRIAWWGARGLYYAVPASEARLFPDVPAGQRYLTAIEGITSKGIMTGYGDGNFGPNDWLIHQQFALMIDLTMGYQVSTSDVYDFADKPPIVDLDNGSLYPYHDVSAAVLKGWMTTYADDTFRPLYRERRNEAIVSLVAAGGTSLVLPPTGYVGQLTDDDPAMALALETAEYNGLLENIVGPDGTLGSWDPTQPVTRAEMAQLLWNLLPKVQPIT